MSSSSKSLEPGSPKSITAPFAPYGSSSTTRQQKTVLVRQKTPLLVATPPQITRALAQCHPFLLTLDKVAGLLLWSSGDPWESFLLVASFWVIVLYGDPITRWGGPILLVTSLIVGMYSKRYSPLSSTRFTGEKRKRNKREDAEEQIRHQKSLDEIVDTLDNFTSRCNLLLEPFLQLTDFLSTQQTPTSATSRPTLTTFFTRIILITPLWIVLTLPPMRIITSRRVVLAVGTLGLSWHSRPARVTRTLLWRSLTIRRIVSIVTGLSFIDLSLNTRKPPPLPPRSKNQHDRASSLANTGEAEAVGVRFTFVLYENQRRWLGLGWTSSLFNYERAPWTDEHLQPSPPKDQFQLPDVDSGMARWRWVPGCEWKFESNVELDKAGGAGGTNEDGWIYYDNKWNDGRRQDGWGRYTRRRKWYRDAELVDISAETVPRPETFENGAQAASSSHQAADSKDTQTQNNSQTKRKRLPRRDSRASNHSSIQSGRNLFSDDNQDHLLVERSPQHEDWGINDDVKMGLG